MHHIDQNKSNNDPDNLLVFKSRNAHSQFHAGGTIILDRDGIADCISTKGNKCLMCGAIIYRQSKYCNACAHLL